eukprot:TRINITY_DN22471_c0_g1_i1.p1 TRINITY_DN22471_c0_g1~~TRINITY_DN22471_c0_g1_i1.p1  ORF type:complete len:376 (+),score=66.00 TRINITY_DN22471_c0_g1_i1:55-1182(+)
MNALDFAGVLRELPSLGAALAAARVEMDPADDLLSSCERFFTVTDVKYKEEGRYPCVACAADFCQKYGRNASSEEDHSLVFEGKCGGRGGLCDVSLQHEEVYYQCTQCHDIKLCHRCFDCGDHFPHTLKKVLREVPEQPSVDEEPASEKSEPPPTQSGSSSGRVVPTSKTRTLCWEPVCSFFKKVLRKKRTIADVPNSEGLSIAASETETQTPPSSKPEVLPSDQSKLFKVRSHRRFVKHAQSHHAEERRSLRCPLCGEWSGSTGWLQHLLSHGTGESVMAVVRLESQGISNSSDREMLFIADHLNSMSITPPSTRSVILKQRQPHLVCPICTRSQLNASDSTSLLPCGHFIHSSCLDAITSQGTSISHICPLCK